MSVSLVTIPRVHFASVQSITGPFSSSLRAVLCLGYPLVCAQANHLQAETVMCNPNDMKIHINSLGKISF